jgi:hypothetical protein
MTKICVIKSVQPDKPIPDFINWIRWVHYESARNRNYSLRTLEKQASEIKSIKQLCQTKS